MAARLSAYNHLTFPERGVSMGRSKDKATFKGVGVLQLDPLFPSFWGLNPCALPRHSERFEHCMFGS